MSPAHSTQFRPHYSTYKGCNHTCEHWYNGFH